MPKQNKLYFAIAAYEFQESDKTWVHTETKYFDSYKKAVDYGFTRRLVSIRKLTYAEYVYETMCSGCEHEKHCHESCTTCEEFDDAIEKGN